MSSSTAPTARSSAVFAAFMSAVCGPTHRDELAAALGAAAVERAERKSRTFVTNEMPGLGAWPFDDQVAARITQPVLQVQGGASPPPVHRLIARLARLLPDAEVSTIDGDNHMLRCGARRGYGVPRPVALRGG